MQLICQRCFPAQPFHETFNENREESLESSLDSREIPTRELSGKWDGNVCSLKINKFAALDVVITRLLPRGIIRLLQCGIIHISVGIYFHFRCQEKDYLY